MTNREIDALVAEKVMGWQRKQDTMTGTDGWLKGKGTMWASSFMWTSSFAPTTDIADAWQVVEKFENQGYQIQIDVRNGRTKVWIDGKGDFFTNVGVHGKTSMAICLAALKTIGIEVDVE